ncbi:hypothetical protein ACC759_37035, partial [Rhizobium ruizarguesonis]
GAEGPLSLSAAADSPVANPPSPPGSGSRVSSPLAMCSIRFLFVNLLMWHITLVDLFILKNLCIPEINPT